MAVLLGFVAGMLVGGGRQYSIRRLSEKNAAFWKTEAIKRGYTEQPWHADAVQAGWTPPKESA